MGGRQFWCAIGCALSLLTCQHLGAQEEDEEEPHLPGIIASYYQLGHPAVERIEPVAARHGSHLPDERLQPNQPYTVTWRGLLLVPDDGEYQLHVHGQGNVEILLKGEPILRQGDFAGWLSTKPQQFTFGPVPIEISYRATKASAQFALFWSSDRFEREPVPARALAHDRMKTISADFDRGRVLARALRCEACHTAHEGKSAEPMPAPALDQLAGNMHRDWLVRWLRDDGGLWQLVEAERPQRRMPFLNIPEAEARLLADWLLSGEPQKPLKPEAPAKERKAKPRTNAELHAAGQTLFRTKGCLACHAHGENRDAGLFGGGDLNYVAAKRPREFFAAWLQKPESLNRDHRMPVFELSAEDREALTYFLSMQGKPPAGGEGQRAGGERKQDYAQARELAKKYRCDACHRLPDAAEVAKLPAPRAVAALTAKSDWQQTCVVESAKEPRQQPLLWFSNKDGQELQTYFTKRAARTAKQEAKPDGAQLILENNCLACHNREQQLLGILPPKLSEKLVRLADEFPDLAAQLPAMTPPSLNSVGDKLTDTALANAITRAGPAHRPYLQVQMPRFRLSKEQTATLAGHFIDFDRIPDYERGAVPEPTPAQQAARTLAGKRLVGTDGFSCTACHQVGSVQPVKAPPNARGPTLSMMQDRLRKTWFDRWVRNPARIVPRMEMPSVQTPVRGVLQDNLPEQLAAVWQTLNTPGFEPPLPEPVRTLRFYSSEDNRNKQPLVITDLIEHDGKTLERAALIGLPNRHNLLFDFATNRLLSWSQGDLARQRTKGKNWYWEPAGSALLNPGLKTAELALELEDRLYEGVTDGQWIADPSVTKFGGSTIRLGYPLLFRRPDDRSNESPFDCIVEQFAFSPDEGAIDPHLTRGYTLERFPTSARLHWRLLDAKAHGVDVARDVVQVDDGLRIRLKGKAEFNVSSNRPASFTWQEDGTVVIKPQSLEPGNKWKVVVGYRSLLPADEYHAPRPPELNFPPPPVVIAPGFSGERLGLPADVMPTAISASRGSRLAVASLKGQVLLLDFGDSAFTRSNPRIKLLSDGLAAPYGIHAEADYVDVVTKYALIRLTESGETRTETTIAAGWGYTADYHDWCVGLPRDEQGNYYLALPCYQDNRPRAAQHLRGSVLKLWPRLGGGSYGIEVLSFGHRFPMGMALNAKGELFVSDNQGNYNPFNELNFVRQEKHFGFVNKGDHKPEEVTSPAIEIPHPWTRSVNGICFLTTSKGLQKLQKGSVFGPLEGHLVGCEYDTRRLIRMSLQRVGDDYQGCCYPLTIPSQPEESPLGPVCCEVSPTGELFIGSIRDSGWGAGNNIGEVIRVQVDPTKFGHGIAEMRATATGFELDFFSPVEKELAEQLENFTLSSYRRESTPAYGGNDIDRRTEKVAKVALSPDRKRVTLTLDTLRPGYVYELRLKSLAPAGEFFFPAEAHYTLRQLVK